nr:histone-lysine N-methyltransferase family member SUVH9-like [Tanacetum cinerariifolium]
MDKYKARLVIKGFSQKEGLDYKHTFSLVAKLATVRVLIAIAIGKGWPLHQLDVNNAFLHGFVDEKIYMKPPEGYTKATHGQVCKLNKSLYGLKQASRQWNFELSNFLLSLGFTQLKHVIIDTKKALDQKFTIKDLGLVRYFSGIELCNTAQGTYLHQRKCILDLLQDAGLTVAKPTTFPRPQNLKVALNKGNPIPDAESEDWPLCKGPRGQDNRSRDVTRKTVPVEIPNSSALVSCDGLEGYDGSDQAKEGPTNYALMAYSTSSASSSYSKWLPGKIRENNKGKAACVKTETCLIPGLTYEDYQLFLKHISGTGNSEGTKPVANMAHKEDEEGVWIFDSGCTEYITYLFEILVNKKSTHFEAPVVIPNGDSIPIKGKGDYILSGGTKVNGVLCVLDFKCNLLSGVRSLDLIQSGSFIREYTEVVLSIDQAKLFTMNGDALVYPNRFEERWAEWGDLSQIFTDYVCLSYPSIPLLGYGMDVSRMRNLACYMSHNVCPNVLVQLVLYEYSHYAFPHLILFAMEIIRPLRELSLDYGAAPPDEASSKLAI